MTNSIVFQIRGDMNNDEEKVKAKARQIRDLYGKISSVFKEALKNAVYDEDSILYNTINQWIIKKELNRQQEAQYCFDKTNTIAGAPFENSHENRESKTLRRCKNCHEIGHYAKTCTGG
ncbi:unnamed protein product [Rhizophagus irregularis]|uniref:CCHC-type domain-containing protein n=1 Tax=Rhizophagus irregularis TaxID=588596 RepID=A0A915ZQY3_9GLOM|nr:unnamed protein product [Rhizophagus irregularis]